MVLWFMQAIQSCLEQVKILFPLVRSTESLWQTVGE